MYLNQEKIHSPLLVISAEWHSKRSPVPNLPLQLINTTANRSVLLIHIQLSIFLSQYYQVFLLCLDKPYIHARNIHVYQCSLEKQNQEAQPSSTIHTWLPWLELTGRGREGEEGRTVREEQFDLELAAVSLESSLI